MQSVIMMLLLTLLVGCAKPVKLSLPADVQHLEPGREATAQEGHNRPISSVSFSPDGQYVLSGSWDAALKLWEASSGRLVKTFQPRDLKIAIQAAAFSPDGRSVVSVSEAVRVWDVASGREIRSIQIFISPRSAAFSHDGRYVAVGSREMDIRIVDIVSGKEIKAFRDAAKRAKAVPATKPGEVVILEERDGITALSFSMDGKYILSGHGDGTITLWDVATGRVATQTFSGHASKVTSVAFTHDGRYALSSSNDNTIKIWNAVTGGEIRTIQTGAVVNSTVFSSDVAHIISAGQDKTVRLWQTATGEELRIFSGHLASISCVAASADGRYAFSGSYDDSLKLWDIASGREIWTIFGKNKLVSTAVSGKSDEQTGVLQPLSQFIKPVDEARDPDHPIISVQLGHTMPIAWLSFSAGGSTVISAGHDETVRVWDAETGRELKILNGGQGPVFSAAYSPDGKHALTGGTDGILRLWDLAAGRMVRAFAKREEIGFYTAIDFSPDGKYAISGHERPFTAATHHTMELWDVATGRSVRTFPGHAKAVMAVKFSRDGKSILSASADKTIKLWDAMTGRVIRSYIGHTDSVLSIAVSRDGRYALSGSEDATMRLWDIAAGKEVRRFDGHKAEVYGVAYSPDGKYAFSGSRDGTLKLWDIVNGRNIKTIVMQKEPSRGVAFSPDGRAIGAGFADATIKLWEVASGREISELAGHGSIVNSVALSPDGNHILTANGDGSSKLWESSSGRLISSFQGHADPVISVAFSPNGSRAVSGSLDKTVRLWDISSRKEVFTIRGLSGNVRAVAFSPDGKFVVSGSEDGLLKLWDATSGREERTFIGHDSSVRNVAVSPDGKHIMSNDRGNRVRLWNLSTGKEIRAFGYDFLGCWALAFSPDGKYAVAGDAVLLNTLRMFEVESGREIAKFLGHQGTITSATFTRDGRYLVTGSIDRTIRVWDITSGKEVRRLQDAGAIMSIACSPDGNYVYSGGVDTITRKWNIVKGKELAQMIGFRNDEWVTMTPEGYFKTSRDGATFINARLHDKVYGLDQFYDVFYRPDIVDLALQGGDVSDLAPLNLADALRNPPPVVAFVRTPADTRAKRPMVTFRVTSTGGGIGDVRIFHNGKLIRSDGFYREAVRTTSQKTTLLAFDSQAIRGQIRGIALKGKLESLPLESRQKGEVYTDTVSIDAVPGENEIAVTAFNKDNTVQGMMKTIRFMSDQQPEAPKLYVLAVGIDQYRADDVNLRYAVKDAVSLSKKLAGQAAGLYEPQNIHVSLLSDERATKESILGAVSGLSKTVKPTDGFVLFIAGHGILNNGLYSIITHDFDGTLAARSLITSNEIMDISKAITSLNQLFILDTCHAGGLDSFLSGLYDARMTVLARNMGLHMFASASTAEEALDGYNGNGMFTHTLLDGLDNNRKADWNDDKQVSVEELGNFAKESTIAISRKLGHKQNPLIINFGKDSPLYVIR